jgi:sorbitol-specific phosphotransferase system component IIA
MMLKTCPNVTYVELHLGDILQSQLRELGHLLIEFLERQLTLTRAIKY